ncbi:MAG: tRNA 2-selenouridine(34) synthase MnmH [Planctomycetota bacterium]|nr:tRNA 2-selenouridine(34) synthase MnmH [Planctomycetota bacterium]
MSRLPLEKLDLHEIYKALATTPEKSVAVESFCKNPRRYVIDVRSPGEFKAGHVPGAVNVPLFSDEQRAEIGTTYKELGSEKAVDLGLEITTGQLSRLVSGLEKVLRAAAVESSHETPVLHCWRGGMRSRAVKWLCSQMGYPVELLEDGYKGFRRFGNRELEQARKIIVLAGPTGVGNTKLLHRLAELGEQVIDLEGLAKHRGSVFGGLEGIEQPTVEQFQNEIYTCWHQLDPNRLVWVEGESQMIGRAVIPEGLWKQIIVAPMIFAEASVEDRAVFLLEDYGSRDAGKMKAFASRIKKRLGGLRYQESIDAVDRGDWREFCLIMLNYYDKYYQKALEKRAPETFERIKLMKPGLLESETELIELAEKMVNRSLATRDSSIN